MRVAAGIACAIAGIALVAFARDAEGELASGSLAGIALLVGAVTCEALYVVIGKKLSASIGPQADQRPHQPVGPRAGRAVRALAAARLLAVVHPRVVVVAAARLFDRRQRRHGVALDDRA